jgi:hypothetical protein
MNRIALIVAGLILVGQGVNAIEEPVGPQGLRWDYEARAGVGYYFPGKLKGTDAEVKGAFIRGSASATISQDRDFRATFGVDSTQWYANWSAPIQYGNANGEPFDRVEQVGVRGSVFYRLSEDFSLGGFGNISLAKGYSPQGLNSVKRTQGDTFTLGSVLIYQVNPQLSVSAGVMYSSQLEESNLLIPIFAVRYRHNPHWSFNLFDVSGIDNFDIFRADYDPSGDRKLVVSGSVQWANQSYIVGRFIEPGNNSRLAVEDRAYRLLLGATMNFDRGFYVQPYVGYDLYRKMKFISREQTLNSYRIRQGWVVGLNVGAKF